jgi:hypothetical protein
MVNKTVGTALENDSNGTLPFQPDRPNWEIENAHFRHRRYVLAGAAAPYQSRPRGLRVTRTPDAPDGVIAYALKASGFGFETVSALIEHGLAEARLQRACPSVVVVRHRTNEKAK